MKIFKKFLKKYCSFAPETMHLFIDKNYIYAGNCKLWVRIKTNGTRGITFKSNKAYKLNPKLLDKLNCYSYTFEDDKLIAKTYERDGNLYSSIYELQTADFSEYQSIVEKTEHHCRKVKEQTINGWSVNGHKFDTKLLNMVGDLVEKLFGKGKRDFNLNMVEYRGVATHDRLTPDEFLVLVMPHFDLDEEDEYELNKRKLFANIRIDF